jgi:hypothetical protein
MAGSCEHGGGLSSTFLISSQTIKRSIRAVDGKIIHIRDYWTKMVQDKEQWRALVNFRLP